MVHAARALRMGVMLGCMLESGLGIAAGCCVAPLCDHVDLDGNLLLRADPWPGVELVDGVQIPSLDPGLGVSPACEARPRRLLVLGEGFSHDPHYGKTMRGIIRYGPDPVVAILDSPRAGEDHDGIPVVGDGRGRAPVRADGRDRGRGDARRSVPARVARAPGASASPRGLDVESGLHEFLADDPELAELARSHGVSLRDLRRPPRVSSVPTGANLEVDSTIVLTVGSDCAIGKKTVAVELDLEARGAGLPSVFVPTGQTGIAIAGWGIAVDAVVADFLAGAAERLVVEGARRGGKLLFVEGQGSLVHPMYSGVTLGLVHGSAPHAFVLCHRAGATEIEGCPGHPIPPLSELIELHERVALPARKAKVACVALNTAEIASEDAARRAIAEVEDETGLPADDPVRFGADQLLDALLARL